MDRNTITGLILIFAVFVGFSIYNNSRMNKAYMAVIEVADSLYAAGDLENARAEYINALRFKPNQPEAVEKVNEINRELGFTQATRSTDTIPAADAGSGTPLSQIPGVAVADSGRYGAFGASATGTNEFITLENNRIELKIATRGGRVYSARVKEYVTHDSLPLILFSGDSTIFGFNFYTADNKAIQTNDLYFTPVGDRNHINVTDAPGSVTLRLHAGSDKYIEYKYTLEPDRFMVDFDVTFKSLEDIIAPNLSSIVLDWRMYLPQQEKGRQNEEYYTTIKYKFFHAMLKAYASGSRRK